MDRLTPIIREAGDKIPLYVRIYEQLFRLIEANYFKEGDKLPGELTLSKELGVSRSSVRQALLILQEDGIIHNVQGKGNFLVKTKKNIEVGLEKICNIMTTFNNDAYDHIAIDKSYEMPSEWIRSVLKIQQNKLVVLFYRRYKMNSDYVCYNITVIPYEYLMDYNLDMENEESLLDFLDNTIYNTVSSSKTDFKITTAGAAIAEKLNVAEETVLICLEEIMYKDSGEHFVLSKSYFRPEFYEFHINRRKI
jgi:GntR family transcriptional regulator